MTMMQAIMDIRNNNSGEVGLKEIARKAYSELCESEINENRALINVLSTLSANEEQKSIGGLSYEIAKARREESQQVFNHVAAKWAKKVFEDELFR